jgi:RND family efflux transporter MFP subunit
LGVIVIANATATPIAFAAGDAAPVEMATVVPQGEAEPLWVPGTVVSRQDSSVAPEISGRLDWLADVGDHVEAGAPIARISDDALRIQLRIDDADIERLDANVEYVRRQVDRFVELANSNSTAASEVDRLTMELRMLEQERAAAAARRDQTLRELNLVNVGAPFAGLIVERNSEVGEFASVGEPILRMVNTANLEVVARAPIEVARHTNPGDVVNLRSEAASIKAPVRALIPSSDVRSRGVEVRVELPVGSWIVGEPVRIALDAVAEPARIAVPRDALVLRDGQVHVFRLLADATAQQIPVRVGSGVGDLVSVEGDLGVGDQVVVRGAEGLKDGQPVRVLMDGAFARARSSRYESG